jgi:hypothetical protein
MEIIYNVIRAISILLIFPGGIMAVDEPKYDLIIKAENYEIRSYYKTLVAETLIDDSFENSGNRAFRILADYIFGNNLSKTKIDMTAPVTMQKNSIEISKSTKMLQSMTANGYLFQFTMPEKFTIENIPTPNDSRVLIKSIDKRKVAVYSYSGSWSEEKYKNNLKKFKDLLKVDSIATTGEPIFARYNSPFQLWFLRRNEIMFQIIP